MRRLAGLLQRTPRAEGDPALPPGALFRNEGFCHTCGKEATFTAYGEWLREYYLCDTCRSVPRERALMYCIETFFPGWREALIHESSPAARGASVRLKAETPRYIPTQFYPGVPRGEMHDGFRCEDLEHLTFADESIDLHVTQDVIEHLFDPAQGFREIARTLRPGGAHIFTTPLVNKERPTQWCARLRADGGVEHLIDPPEYHGSPVSEQGSLVTVHWGYDIARFIHDSCGLFTEMVHLDALEWGIRAEYIEVLITRKPSRGEEGAPA